MRRRYRLGHGRYRLTADRLSNVPEWIKQGESIEAIAERLGVKPGSLVTTCSIHRISLDPRTYGATLQIVCTRRARRVITTEAKDRGMTKGALMRALIEAICRDDLFKAVLDTE